MRNKLTRQSIPFPLILLLISTAFGHFVNAHWEKATAVDWNSTSNSWQEIEQRLPPLNDLIWTGEQFVGVSASENIATSPDGEFWSIKVPEGGEGFRGMALAANNERIVAVGNGGNLLHSQNGIDWERVSLDTSASLQGVAFGSNVWVAVGLYTLFTSSNGIEWVNQSKLATPTWTKVAFGDGTFVAASTHGSYTYTSTDGINWSQHNVSELGNWEKVALKFLKDRFFVATKQNLFSSTDGITWKIAMKQPEPDLPQIQVVDLTYTHRRFIALAEHAGSTKTFSSIDGETWHGQLIEHPTPTVKPSLIVANEDVIIVPSASRTTKRLNFHHPMRKIESVVFGNDRFVAVGSSGRLISSPDGINWTEQVSPTFDALWKIIYTGNHFIAVGSRGTMITSPDGESWSIQTLGRFGTATPSDHDLQKPFWLGITHGNGRYVAVGANHAILFSDDLETWQQAKGIGETTSLKSLRSVAFGEGNFVAIGHDGTIKHSPDGEHWTRISYNQIDSLNSVAYGNGRFVAVSMTGLVLVSTTGEEWSIHSADPTRSFSRVRFIDGTFIAVSWEGDLFSSSDGKDWTKDETLQAKQISDVAGGAGKLVTVGADGGIFHTPALPSIYSQPMDQTVAVNEPFIFSVAASGNRDLTYQWYWNDQPIPGATDALFESENGAKISDEGFYRVSVDDGIRKIWSIPARLNVEADYIDWLAETSYTEEELSDPQISAPTSDPGGHNIPNLLRYAFSLDPHAPDRTELPRFEKHPPLFYGKKGDQFVFNIPRIRETESLQLTVETSSNLTDWFILPNPPNSPNSRFRIFPSGNRDLVVFDEREWMHNDKLFYRVKAEISEK